MIPFKMLLLKYWNAITGARLHFIAKLQRNSYVDRIQVVSPECISIMAIMSNNTIEDCPGPKKEFASCLLCVRGSYHKIFSHNLDHLKVLEISYFDVNVKQTKAELLLLQNLFSILTSCEALKIFKRFCKPWLMKSWSVSFYVYETILCLPKLVPWLSKHGYIMASILQLWGK